VYITIAIPFYNAEKFLLDAIKSVFAQTHTEWELILIDDGSTDKSLGIAKSIKDPRVRVYSDGENRKLASRLNEIVKLAKYDIIARMDADDLMSPYRIEKQVKVLTDNPSIDLVTTGLFTITDELVPVGIRWHHNVNITFDDLINNRGCGVVHAAIMGRKEWFIRNSYNEKLKIAQDFELWVRSFSNNDLKIYLIQEPLYFYREINNVTIRKLLLAYKNQRKIYYKYGRKKKLILIISSFIKTGIVLVLSKLGKLNFLFNKRSRPICDNSLIDNYNSEVKIILETVVPSKPEGEYIQ
jgi:glycosyltransferase involved in cell wall biosynthesis